MCWNSYQLINYLNKTYSFPWNNCLYQLCDMSVHQLDCESASDSVINLGNGSYEITDLNVLWNMVPDMCKYSPPIYQFQAVKLNYTGIISRHCTKSLYIVMWLLISDFTICIKTINIVITFTCGYWVWNKIIKGWLYAYSLLLVCNCNNIISQTTIAKVFILIPQDPSMKLSYTTRSTWSLKVLPMFSKRLRDCSLMMLTPKTDTFASEPSSSLVSYPPMFCHSFNWSTIRVVNNYLPIQFGHFDKYSWWI